MYAESLTGAVDIRDEDDDQQGSVGDYMFTPMYTYVYDYRYRCPPAYSEVCYVYSWVCHLIWYTCVYDCRYLCPPAYSEVYYMYSWVCHLTP